jgi:hypothetical protein
VVDADVAAEGGQGAVPGLVGDGPVGGAAQVGVGDDSPSRCARVNIIFGRRDKVDDGLAHLEDADRGAVEATAGNLGLTTFADREAGVIVAVSYWDEPTHSSEAVLTRAREDAAAAAGGDLVVESYEVAARERRSVPLSGATVRVERVQIDSSNISDGVAFIRDEVLPQLRTGAGFCSAELLIDRGAGAGQLLTAWTTAADASRAETVLQQLRDEAVERVGTKFPRTETYTLVRTSAPAG